MIADLSIPRFLIDDTAEIGDARVFVCHTRKPRFFAEIVPEEDATRAGIEFSGLPKGEVATRIHWIDDPVFDADEMIEALSDALDSHWAIRERGHAD